MKGRERRESCKRGRGRGERKERRWEIEGLKTGGERKQRRGEERRDEG